MMLYANFQKVKYAGNTTALSTRREARYKRRYFPFLFPPNSLVINKNSSESCN
jgi:hypothetical protein